MMSKITADHKGQQISAVIITKNEEKNLAKCLESLPFCDEIIVVDSMSTDQTEIIARKNPKVKFFNQPFLGYGPQKRMAVNMASNDWIFSIDADEWATEQLTSEMLQLKPSLDHLKYKIFSIPRTLIFLGKSLNFSGENKRPVIRFFNRKYANFNDVLVHEEIVPLASLDKNLPQIFKLKHELLHQSYSSLEDYLGRLNHYTTAMSRKILDSKSSDKQQIPSTLILGVRFFYTFIKIYVFYAGFMDGIRGFIWSLSSAFANAIKYAKYYELLLNKQSNQKN